MSTASTRAVPGRRPMVAGNWKMNGAIATNEQLIGAMLPALESISGVDLVVCPPYPYLGQLRGALAGATGAPGPVAFGAQNVAAQAPGAFTGEVAAEMLVDLGCRWVIIGHSERRAFFAEDDATVLAKTKRALEVGLNVIVCVGESLQEREAGRAETVVGTQLAAVLPAFAQIAHERCVVAYEPVWAIGTGKTATPETAQQMHAFIRAELARHDEDMARDTRILYGGSVKGANAASLFSQADIDGGLIGGAALQPDEFITICRAAA